MAFSNQDRINLVTKALAAGVIDANSSSQWYETIFPFTFNLNADAVFTQLDVVRQYPASNRTEARDNVANHLQNIVQDYSQNEDAVRLYEVAGTNQTTYAAYVGGDPSNGVLNNWLLPQLVPQSGGMASNGYGVLLYDGDPANGGSVVSTTFADNSPTTGANKSVGWLFNYSNGMLLVSEEFKAAKPSFDPYILAFRYIGSTAQTAFDDIAIVKTDLLALTAAFDAYEIATDDRLAVLEAQILSAVDGAANVGTGEGVFAQKVGTELQFKSIQAGDNVRIESDGNSITISAEGGGRTGMIARFVKGG